ncbi:MAG: hypothetical protein KTR13_00795, partial [Saprospiraceae bacterium]|nr:hypothetical protein [Saprospiraceae bacterium]
MRIIYKKGMIKNRSRTTMRRIYYFSFIFCFSLAFQACGDDDTAQEPEPEPVILAEAVETYEAGAFFEGYTLFAPN